MIPAIASEKSVQKSVITLFTAHLGYTYLGNWTNSHRKTGFEESLFRDFLSSRGYTEADITSAVRDVHRACIAFSDYAELYSYNKNLYSLLKYGITIRQGANEKSKTIPLIDFTHPANNHFAIAEEVSIENSHHADGYIDKRIDLVLYVNGFALATIQLKKAIVSVGEAIRQSIADQKAVPAFFGAVQYVFAGNTSEGLRYGTIGTPEKYFLRWKEEAYDFSHFQNTSFDTPLHRDLASLCTPERFLSLVHDFVVFDNGIKKLCRPHQFFAIQNTLDYIHNRHQGGIIWHTQGSGKSLTMVWLANYLTTTIPHARILIITDRTELDTQIKQNFDATNEGNNFHAILRAESSRELLSALATPTESKICALIHKFGRLQTNESLSTEDQEAIAENLIHSIPSDFQASGRFFVFIDECHRTQSGSLHRAMKKLLPDAIFIGFTGTPLLVTDKATSQEVFGNFIHTYKVNEAIEDGVVLPLTYEQREITQHITSKDAIDNFFQEKTKGLSDYALAKIKSHWAKLSKLTSSKERLQHIVMDIILDFQTKERLARGTGNALLVADSVYSAFRFYQLFVENDFPHCAVISSFSPTTDTSDSGLTESTDIHFKTDIFKSMIAQYYNIPKNDYAKYAEKFEGDVKKDFIKHPDKMKLLIVVDKLLTGFDAPPCTYMYIDKEMQNHGLFQAITRVNRLHDETKDFGYIIDYRQLFNRIQKTMHDYTSGAFAEYDSQDIQDILSDKISKLREKLDITRESLKALCEGVSYPQGEAEYIQYFVNHENQEIATTSRHQFYKLVGIYARTYSALAPYIDEAGYSADIITTIKDETQKYSNLRFLLLLASGENTDYTSYSAEMQYLIDNFIGASPSSLIFSTEGKSLLDTIQIHDLPTTMPGEVVLEVITGKTRKLLVQNESKNPIYYQKLSEIFEELLNKVKHGDMILADFVHETSRLIDDIYNPSRYPSSIDTPEKQAIYDYLDEDLETTLALDIFILQNKREDWFLHPKRKQSFEREIQDNFPLLKDIQSFMNLIAQHSKYR